MIKMKILFMFISLAMIGFLIVLFVNNKDNFTKNYKGLVLFDIDGTLTSNNALDNYSIVQACIDNSFAVGICTAGSVYSMENILSYNWMPKNLYDFIVQENMITFNNVGSKILLGKPNELLYSKLSNQHPGFLKGFALEKAANALGITNPKCMILCDDDIGFIQNFRQYNPNLSVVCSGISCGGFGARLNIDDVKNAMVSQ